MARLKAARTGGGLSFSLREVVRLTGLSQHTVRYYEGVGLIPAVRRNPSSNHRTYSSDDVSRLEALSCMRALGMRLDEMKAYLNMASRDQEAHRGMVALLERQRERLHERLTEIHRHIEYNDLKLSYWRATEKNDKRKAASVADRLLARLQPGGQPGQEK